MGARSKSCAFRRQAHEASRLQAFRASVYGIDHSESKNKTFRKQTANLLQHMSRIDAGQNLWTSSQKETKKTGDSGARKVQKRRMYQRAEFECINSFQSKGKFCPHYSNSCKMFNFEAS